MAIFGGPSLHFHKRSIHADIEPWTEKLELVYATLASWGMHRMGSNGSKMRTFETFKDSASSVKSHISTLSKATPNQLSHSDWNNLEMVFKAIKVMKSGTSVIGNSKALAHLLPNIFAPIDRQYTLRYLFNSTSFKNCLNHEWNIAKKIHLDFFHTIASSTKFLASSREWLKNSEPFPWDTSELKIIDNLVIGAILSK